MIPLLTFDEDNLDESFYPKDPGRIPYRTMRFLSCYFSHKNDTFKKQLREKYIPYLIYHNIVREEIRIDTILCKDLDKIDTPNSSKNYLDQLVAITADKQMLLDERIDRYVDMIFEELNINDTTVETKNKIVINVKKLLDKKKDGKSIVFPGVIDES